MEYVPKENDHRIYINPTLLKEGKNYFQRKMTEYHIMTGRRHVLCGSDSFNFIKRDIIVVLAYESNNVLMKPSKDRDHWEFKEYLDLLLSFMYDLPK